MIRLTVCLLFTSAAFAQHYAAPGAPSHVPMDFNDDIYNRDMRMPPSSNFVFNFEQARRDQPPQVEMREENLGKYMGRPRTTTPVPAMTRHTDPHVPETVHLHHLADEKMVPMKPYVPQQWDPVSSHLPASLPPAPTTPRWMDLSDDAFKNHAHHKPSRHPMTSYQPAPTQAPIPQWNQPAAAYTHVMAPQAEMAYSSNPVPQYMPTSAEHSVHSERYAAMQPKTSSRGNHKFTWSDVAATEAAPFMPSSTPSPMGSPQNRGPPPSIPTLSPWHDGFGK